MFSKIRYYFNRLKLKILKILCIFLLPKNIWIGKHFGTYTQIIEIKGGVRNVDSQSI